MSSATLAQVDEAMQTLDRNVAVQEAALAQADQLVAQVQDEERAARRSVARVSRQVSDLRAVIRARAIAAYVSPPDESVAAAIASRDLLKASQMMVFLRLREDSDEAVTRRFEQAHDQLERQRRRLSAARDDAEAYQSQQSDQLAMFLQAKADQQTMATAIQAHIADQLLRATDLAKTDRVLAGRIAAEQAALQSRLLAQQRAGVDVDLATVIDNQSPDGAELAPLPPGALDNPQTYGIALCVVDGIAVNCIIRDQFAAMLAAARADGVNLTGAGYRSPLQQIALRKAHCGDSYEAIYLMPASACRPPTARPGGSQHEIGLAVDFTDAMSRDTPGFAWLAAHAEFYGFYNLPSEPWHWSTTGN